MMYCPACQEQAVRSTRTNYVCIECGRSFSLRAYDALVERRQAEAVMAVVVGGHNREDGE